MQTLADLGRVESVLLARRSELVQSTSFTFSAIVLIVVLGGFAWFLQVQYELNKEKPQEKRIPFAPTVWYSATRNLRSEEYAGQLQPFEIEVGHGVPGSTDGGVPAEIYRDDYGAPTASTN
jgi:hypothetical protein